MARPKVEEQEKLVMKVSDNIQLLNDGMNIIIQKRVTRKKKDTKEEYLDWDIVGYYSTLENALIKLFNLKILQKTTTPAECLTEIKKAKKEIIGAINEAFPSGNTVSKVKSRNTTLSKGK